MMRPFSFRPLSFRLAGFHACSVLSLLALVSISAATLPGSASAQSASLPAPVASDSRVKTLVYNENDVFNLLTYYGFQSNIEFGPKETIETVSIGDRAGWQLVPAGRRLFVRAVANELHTNMTVVTNLHAYQFDLRATDPATVPQEELVYVIRFFYPDDAEKMRKSSNPVVPAAVAPNAYPMPAATMNGYPTPAPQPSAIPTAPVAATSLPAPTPMPAAASPAAAASSTRYGAGPFDTPVSASTLNAPAPAPANAAPASTGPTPSAPPPSANKNKLNYNYTYTGAGQILPYAMFDDGKRTYFQFLDAKAAPKMKAFQSNGKWKSATLKREGDFLVTSTTAVRFELTSAGQTATIFNEARP